MGKTTTAAPVEAPKKERKIRTIEEQIKDAEAKAAELRARAEKRANKDRDAAWDKRAKAIVRRDQAQAVIDEVDKQYPQPNGGTPADDSTDTES